MRRESMALGITCVLLLGASACTSGSGKADPTGSSAGARNQTPFKAMSASALSPFDDCEDLLGSIQSEALARVSAYGIRGRQDVVAMAGASKAFASSGATEGEFDTSANDGITPTANTPGGQGGEFSETNVQEVGVDEPDLIKTDGEILVAVAQGMLNIVDLTGETPVLAASVDLQGAAANPAQGGISLDEMRMMAPASDAQIFLHERRALVIYTSWSQAPYDIYASPYTGNVGSDRITPLPMPAPSTATTSLIEIDVARPGAPNVLRRLDFDGTYVSARMIDGVVRLVLRIETNQVQLYLPGNTGEEAEAMAEDFNRSVIENTRLTDWVPSYVSVEAGSTTSQEPRTLVDCENVYEPGEFSGLGTLSVTTVDFTDGLEVGETASVVASGETVYASTENLFVATTIWPEIVPMVDDGQQSRSMALPQEIPGSTIHAFDISDPSAISYTGSVDVDGNLLNQFSMSEFDGYLRVATTVQSADFDRSKTDNQVSVIAVRDDALEVVGEVDGIGAGETIHSVRFLGSLGYVVTFRQTDPLYVIDLADPTNPTVAGELKMPGYSAYLHPISDTLLLGIGQNATEEGMVLGSKISLFDVSDPHGPREVQSLSFDQTNSAVENDHRAFLWMASRDLAVVPVMRYGVWDEAGMYMPGGTFEGVLGFTVTPDAITMSGLFPHADLPTGTTGIDPAAIIWSGSGVSRSAIVGENLVTLSGSSLRVANISDGSQRAWFNLVGATPATAPVYGQPIE